MGLRYAGSARIPEATVRRLPMYLRVLADIPDHRREITSAELADLTGYSSEQIRKDFAFFGALGTRGVGYRVDLLQRQIRGVLGLDRPAPAVVIGAGNLGTALARYSILQDRDIRVVALFDVDPARVGTEIEGVAVYHAEEMPAVIRRLGVRMAIVAVPPQAAQGVVDGAVGAGVTAFLNFSPVKIQAPEHVHVQNIDLSLELQSLAYYVSVRSLP
ncbi:MAG TPA: redox-sensing transcriptional repressor Rex [Bacillota bacterium]